MFERFTERARQVVVLSQDFARECGHTHIGTEHLLIGIIREEEGLGCRTLKKLRVVEDTVMPVLENKVEMGEPGEKRIGGQIPFTPQAKLCLEGALREALNLGHNYIGTEHLLLGLIRTYATGGNNMAINILTEMDATPEKIREEVVRMLSGPSRESGKPKPEKPREENIPEDIAQIAVAAKSLAEKVEALSLVTTLIRIERKLDQLLERTDR